MKMNSLQYPGGDMIIVFASSFVCLYLHELKDLFNILLQNALARKWRKEKGLINDLEHLFINCWDDNSLEQGWKQNSGTSVFSHFSSVAQSRPAVCDPMDCSTLCCPSPTPRTCSNSTSIESVMPSNHISFSVVPFSSDLQSFPASGSFPRSQFFTSSGQSIGVSASVLPMNILDWFPLGWNSWISLQSKGLSRVFS